MNNSQINQTLELEENVDSSELLRKKETDLVELLDALDHIRASNYWKTIETKFNAELDILINQLKREKDTTKIFYLQGEIARAEKLDLNKTSDLYRNQLSGIRKQLHAKGNE